MIHVAYATSNLYSKFAATSMLSLFENTNQNVTVHILHDNTLTPENRDKLNFIAGRYGQIVKFYNVDILCPEKITELKNLMPSIINSKFTAATLYRLLMPDVLPENLDKIIYLDSDTVVNLDIKDLYNVELKDKALAVVSFVTMDKNPWSMPMCRDRIVKPEDYFNAGVLVINLEILRNAEKIIREGIIFIANHPQYHLYDQDILNYCFSKNTLHLTANFNRYVYLEREISQKVDKKIYHYVRGPEELGLQLNGADVFNKLWMKYFVMTPFFNEDTIFNLYEGFKNVYSAQKKFAVATTKLVCNKARAFFLHPQIISAMQPFFDIQPDEEIILADSPESLQAVINSLKNSEGKKVFFIFSNEFPAICQIFTRAGFKEGVDFVNVFEFLSDAEGVPLNSYSLVKLL